MERFRSAGLLAVVTLWTSIGTGMYRAGLGFFDDRPLSDLGTDPRSSPLFRGGLLVAAVLLALFSLFVQERFSTPRSFLAASLIGLGGQIVAAVVPISGPGASHDVHTAGGLLLGISLPVLMWRFAAGQVPGRWRLKSYGLFWLEAAACAAGIGLSRSMRAPIAEVLPAGAFHLWIMVVTARSQTATPGPDPPTGA
jgi:hypothetical protein